MQAAKKEPLHAPGMVVMSKADIMNRRGDIPLARQPPPPKPPLAPSAGEDPAMSGLMGRVTSLFSRALYKHAGPKHKRGPSGSCERSDATVVR